MISVTRWPDCFVQYLAIYNDEFLPKTMQKVPKWVHNFAKYQINLWNVAKISKFKIGEISPNLVTLGWLVKPILDDFDVFDIIGYE